jgi:hypothetical protein
MPYIVIAAQLWGKDGPASGKINNVARSRHAGIAVLICPIVGVGGGCGAAVAGPGEEVHVASPLRRNRLDLAVMSQLKGPE